MKIYVKSGKEGRRRGIRPRDPQERPGWRKNGKMYFNTIMQSITHRLFFNKRILAIRRIDENETLHLYTFADCGIGKID